MLAVRCYLEDRSPSGTGASRSPVLGIDPAAAAADAQKRMEPPATGQRIISAPDHATPRPPAATPLPFHRKYLPSWTNARAHGMARAGARGLQELKGSLAQPGKAMSADLVGGEVDGEAQACLVVPVARVTEESVQHPGDQGVACANRAGETHAALCPR